MATLITTTKRGKPVYRVRWNYRRKSLDGKPFDQQEFSTLGEAEAHRKSVEASPTVALATARLVDVANAYQASDHFAALSLRSRQGIEQVCRIHLLPALGNKRVTRITPGDVTAWQKAMLLEGFEHLAPNGKRNPAKPIEVPTANKALRVARAMMKWARTDDSQPYNDAFQVVPQKRDNRPSSKRRSQPRAYSDEDLATLVAACSTLMEATIIIFGACCGFRRQELFALHWDDVDLENGTVSVVRALDSDGTDKDPKTHEERTVPVWAEGIEALRAWRAVAPRELPRVFNEPDGTPCDALWESRHAGKVVERSPDGRRGKPGKKIRVLQDGIRLRSGIHLELGHLRDTYAAELIAQGLSSAEICLAMGHESVETTIRHYAAWLAPRMSDVKQRVDAARAARRAAQ